MATVLEDSPPFLECFGYATLMAEDGRAMHKSWGNSIEFNEAASRMGVDVMRWLYCAHKPENNLLFGYQRADEVRRQFLIPLWNMYHFSSPMPIWMAGSQATRVSIPPCPKVRPPVTIRSIPGFWHV